MNDSMQAKILSHDESHVVIAMSEGLDRTEWKVPLHKTLFAVHRVDGYVSTCIIVAVDAVRNVVIKQGKTRRVDVAATSLVRGYDLDRYIIAGASRRRSSLARVEPTYTEPERAELVQPTNPFAGCTRDSELAEELDKTPTNTRVAIRRAIEAGELQLGGLESARPLVHAREETVSGNTTTVYYLTEAARRVMVLRLDKAKQAAVNQRVATGVAAPASDRLEELLGRMLEMQERTMSTMLGVMDRLAPAKQPLQLPPGAVVVERADAQYPLSQSAIARRLGLPEKNDEANAAGTWARETGRYGVEPWSKRMPNAGPTGLYDGHVMYSEGFLEAFRPIGEEKGRRMVACGWHVADGRMVPASAQATTKAELLRCMRNL